MTPDRIPATRSRRPVAAFAAAVFAAGLTGCASVDDFSEVRQRHELEVRPFDYVTSIDFRPGSAALTRGEQRQFAAFLESAQAEPSNAVVILPRSASDRDSAARIAAERGQTVARYLRRRGFDPQVKVASLDPSGPPGGVDVALRRYVVVLPKCPDWTDRPGENFENQVSSNWGCATVTNFGMMVADPGDIVFGGRVSPARGQRLAQSIERYRRDEVKKLNIETTTEVFSSTNGADDNAAQILKSLMQ